MIIDFIDDYWWLLMIIVSVVCINGGSEQKLFWERLEKLVLLL